MLKRIICLLLILIIFPCSSFAEDIVFEGAVVEPRIPLGGVADKEITAIAVDGAYENYISFFNNLPFDEYIAAVILESEDLPTEITGLSQYNIKKDSFENIYCDTIMRHPEALLKFGGSYEYDTETEIVLSVIPKYLVGTKAEADVARQQIANELESYTSLAGEYETDVEKLLVIHDKMVYDCIYDERVLSEETVNDAPDSVYYALGVFRDKLAVCQGYSQALYMIAKELGIELDFCVSNEIDHMWNYVKLDGKWYHMDMTNDDPEDAYGRAKHTYFLVSDGGLSSTAHGNTWRHYGGRETYICSDTKYESDHLFNMLIPFTARRAEDGYFHVSASFGQTPVDFKSKSLYTGAVVVSPCITTGEYIVIESGVETEKEGTNLYLVQYATRDVPALLPIVKGVGGIGVLGVQNSFLKDKGYLKLILPDVDETRLQPFTTFLWDATNLTPYATKATWNEL